MISISAGLTSNYSRSCLSRENCRKETLPRQYGFDGHCEVLRDGDFGHRPAASRRGRIAPVFFSHLAVSCHLTVCCLFRSARRAGSAGRHAEQQAVLDPLNAAPDGIAGHRGAGSAVKVLDGRCYSIAVMTARSPFPARDCAARSWNSTASRSAPVVVHAGRRAEGTRAEHHRARGRRDRRSPPAGLAWLTITDS